MSSPTEAATSADFPKTAELLAQLHRWAQPLLVDPDFRVFNRDKLKRALDFEDEAPRREPQTFPIPAAWEVQYDAVMAFYFLHTDCERLQDLHLYFRRFPFKPGEVSKRQHLQNVFDLFFAGFYVVQQRLETYLNALKPLVGGRPDFGRLLKRYKKDFESELLPRHQATHERPYDDIVFDRLWMTEIMGLDDQQRDAWQQQQRALYRRETRRWANLARQRARAVLVYVEAVAAFTLESSVFLSPLPSAGG